VVAGRLDGLSPLGALGRGFGVPLDAEGHVLRSAADFDSGTKFVLRVVDGRVSATVDAIEVQAYPPTANPNNARGAEDDVT